MAFRYHAVKVDPNVRKGDMSVSSILSGADQSVCFICPRCLQSFSHFCCSRESLEVFFYWASCWWCKVFLTFFSFVFIEKNEYDFKSSNVLHTTKSHFPLLSTAAWQKEGWVTSFEEGNRVNVALCAKDLHDMKIFSLLHYLFIYLFLTFWTSWRTELNNNFLIYF